ncbi:MAG TPA: FAD-binding protein [Dehalococcoidia bacterium]|nr:FAD-binding protein [Dehalococcoidia bacterium]
MTKWHDLLENNGKVPSWPYPIRYDEEQEIETDVLVIGGGIAGCWAAISAARTGVKVALLEKGDTVRSGAGGPGCDHWCVVPANPHSKVDPDEWAKRLTEYPVHAGDLPKDALPLTYSNGIGTQIQCREDYDTLLELEQMGGKIRDTDDEWIGVEGRYDDTKFMISPRLSPDHATEVTIRVWGTTFKPALKKECQRLGVQVFDRVMVTSLLTEGGSQGTRAIGATGFNNRTGEFIVFKSKATVLATSGDSSLWLLNTELAGYNTFPRSRAMTGDGISMAWNAGAGFTLMESTGMANLGTGFHHTWYGGAGDASYENIQIVDNNGKKLPWPLQGWPDGGAMRPSPEDMGKIAQGVRDGTYALPFFGDFPAMPEIERKVTWKMMLDQESTTRNITNTYERAGFNPDKHLLMNYTFIEGTSHSHWRTAGRGGPLVDWDLKSTLDGLYIGGSQMYSAGDHSWAASTGRYAGRKAAAYASQVDKAPVSRDQITLEKTRIYAPIKRSDGVDWKELHAGISRAMQYFCSDYKNETLLNMGLDALQEIQEVFVPRLYALDPHKLMRSIEDLSMLTHGQIILQASLERKASSRVLNFFRIDYPEIDPPEWNKFMTIKLENNRIVTGELPLDYWGNMKENYEAHNTDYTGVYQEK